MPSIQDHPNWLELSDGVNVISISFLEALDYSQTYENIGGHFVTRTLSGTGLKQSNWAKLRTAVSGSGGIPVGLSALDYSDSLVLKCGAPRQISSASNVIVVPNERRVLDPYLPFAYKRVGGLLIRTASNLVGNTVTVAVDGNADLYGVAYFPEIEVLMNNPSESYNPNKVEASWSFTAEQR